MCKRESGMVHLPGWLRTGQKSIFRSTVRDWRRVGVLLAWPLWACCPVALLPPSWLTRSSLWLQIVTPEVINSDHKWEPFSSICSLPSALAMLGASGPHCPTVNLFHADTGAPVSCLVMFVFPPGVKLCISVLYLYLQRNGCPDRPCCIQKCELTWAWLLYCSHLKT